MTKKLISTGGYPTDMQPTVDQISGLSASVKAMLEAKTPEQIRDAAGIVDEGIAVKGDTGPEGPQGPQGIQGVPGDTGPKGDAGQQGVTGPKGDSGEAGEKGEAGDVGPAGPKGEQGDAGSSGLKGDIGATGATGPQGPKGDTGSTGSTGPQGPAGINATPINFEYVSGTVVTAGTKVSIKFSKTYTSPPAVQPSTIWVGVQCFIAQATDITTTGCNVAVYQSRGTLLLSTGPFENAAAGAKFQMFIIGS